MNFDSNLVRELRRQALLGVGPCSLVALIGRHLNREGENFRLQAIAYFQEAFALPLQDAMRIGAAPLFPGEHRATCDIDDEIQPLLDATAHLWSR